MAPVALAFLSLTLGVRVLEAQKAANTAVKPPATNGSGKKPARSKRPASKIAAIKSFRVIQEKDGSAVEILATHPMIPSIQQINDPTRLVIDLPNARLDTTQKRISVQSDQISTLRADQFQEKPPVTRVVVDLLAPRPYTWEAAGNRLVIHLGRSPTEASHLPFQPPTVAALTPAPPPVVKAVRAAGPLSLVSNAETVGTSFSAGADTAVLTLSTGGELRVCPGTTLSIIRSQNQHNLLLGMNTGSLEAHLQLDASADTVMTPDFRINLVGPGEFHYAFSADNQGNTCVRALPGNTASAIVTELLGDRTYQVKATDQLVFRAGHLDRVDTSVPLECGCPPPRQAIERATNDSPADNSPPSEAPPPTKPDEPQSTDSPRTEGAASGIPASGAPPVPPTSSPNELHVQISAPLVFRATGPAPAPVEDVRALPLDARTKQAGELSVALSPPIIPQTTRATGKGTSADNRPHGFFHKLGHFFASMFH
ncbi:MAG: AMIN domain-containing protein [Terriglobales bacterium]